MKALLLELKAFFSRDLSEYHYQDYLDLSQRARLTLLFVLGILSVLLLTSIGRQWIGSDSNHALIMKRSALQKERLQEEIAGLNRIQESVVFQTLNAQFSDIDSSLGMHESLNLHRVSRVVRENNEAQILGQLRSALAFYGLSLSHLTPKREAFMLRSDIHFDDHFNRVNVSKDSSFQNNRVRTMAIDFHRYFQRVEMNVGIGQRSLKSLSTGNQGSEINYPERIIFTFQTCGTYADLFAGLSRFAYQVDEVVSLDQFRALDRERCEYEPDAGIVATPHYKSNNHMMQITLSVYALTPLHTYLAQVDAFNHHQSPSQNHNEPISADMTAFEIPLSTNSLERWLVEDQYQLLRRFSSMRSAFINFHDRDRDIDWEKDNGNESIYQRYPFAYQSSRVDANSDTTQNSFMQKKEAPVLWQIGTTHQGALLLGVIGLKRETMNQYAIIKTREGVLKTLRSEHYPQYLIAADGIHIMNSAMINDVMFQNKAQVGERIESQKENRP